MSYLYLTINLASISLPLFFSFHPKYPFAKTWKAFWPACLITALAFIIWDIYFTKMGVWGFNPKYLLGLDVFNLPLEECLFFICIPYATTFTYFVLKHFYRPRLSKKLAGTIYVVLAIVCGTVACFNHDKWYTASSFALAAIVLAIVGNRSLAWKEHFLICFLIITLPFTIVNGLLTGSWIPEEVVWYNDFENLGLRFLTIPVDDFSYSLALQLITVMLYEFLIKNFLDSNTIKSKSI